MIPDEPTATAEAPEATSAEDLTPKDQPVPASEQEPPSKEEGESVAAGPEDEGDKGEVDSDKVRKEFIESIGSIKDADPDLYKELFPEEQERQPSEDDSALELAQLRSQVARQEARQKTQAAHEQSYAQAIASVQPALQEFHNDIAAQNLRVKDGQAETVSPVYDKLSQTFIKVRDDAALVGYSLAADAHADAVQDTLESHPTHRFLDASDRKRIGDAPANEREAVRIKVQLDAALKRGASAETKTQAKKDAEAAVNMVERLEKAKAFLGQNGARKPVEAGGPTSHENESEVLMDENTPVKQLKEIRDRQKRDRGG